MRVLVLGGTRFIGRAVVAALHARGHQVTVFNRGLTPGPLPEGVARVTGDIRALAASRDHLLAARPEVVVHAIVIDERDAADAVRIFEGHARRLVMLSSMDVYRAYGRLTRSEPGPPDPVPLGEEAPLRERLFPYRERFPDPGHRLHHYDKIPAERAVLAALPLEGVVLRLPMVLGPRDYQHRLFAYLRPMLDGWPQLPLQEDLAPWRSTYGYVDNIAHGAVLACEAPAAAGRVYNVADIDLSTRELVAAVARATGWQGEVTLLPRSKLPAAMVEDIDARQSLVCSTVRIREELGYAEVVPLDRAIRETVAWERDNPPDKLPPALTDRAARDELLRGLGLRAAPRP